MHIVENLSGSVKMQLKINSFLQWSQNKVLFLMNKEMNHQTNQPSLGKNTWCGHEKPWDYEIAFFPVTQFLSIAASIILKLLPVALEFGVSSVTIL